MGTVLSLRGVLDAATDRELAEALSTLLSYELAAAKLLVARSAGSRGASNCRLAESAAVEQAFMFVRFHSVLPPNAAQLKALNEWLATGKFHPATRLPTNEAPDRGRVDAQSRGMQLTTQHVRRPQVVP